MITEKFILENKDEWEEYRKEINELDSETLIYIIKKEPDIINIIDLDKLNSYDIYAVLSYQPKLIKDLKPYLDKLTEWDIYWVLINQPKLFPYIKPYLHELDEADKRWVLRNRPELSLFFKYRNTEYQDAAYYYTCPSEISKLDEEEKYELSKKIAELIKKEKR